jgi:serine/threonine-protein kinase RsbW
MAPADALELELPSDVQQIERVVALVADRAAQHRFPDRQVRLNLRVALSEALANAMLRGNAGDAAKSVGLRVEWHAERVVMEVADDGAGFDLEACTDDPTTPANLGREDGRGLWLMRALCHHVEQYVDGRNVVRLVLRRD